MTEQSAVLKNEEQEEVDNAATPPEGQDNTEQDLEPEETVTIDGDATEDGGEPEPKFDPKAFVKIDDPAVQAKFNDLYKQVKMSDNRNQVLTKFLTEQQKQLDEFKTRFNQTDHAEAGRILNARLKDARDSGDDATVDRIQQEIIDFRVDMKLNEIQRKQPQKPQPALDPDEAYIDQMGRETDQSGAPTRPWMNESHPEHERAVKVATFLAQKFEQEYGYRDIPEIMKRIDQQMTKKPPAKTPPQNRAPDPFQGGNLTNRRPDHKLKLSDAEKDIARKLGLSEKDYLANK